MKKVHQKLMKNYNTLFLLSTATNTKLNKWITFGNIPDVSAKKIPSVDYKLIKKFLDNECFVFEASSIISQTNKTKIKFYKGTSIWDWFMKVIKSHDSGVTIRTSLAKHNLVPGYEHTLSSHRKIFYVLIEKIRIAIYKLSVCKNKEEVMALNWFSELAFGKGGRPATKYVEHEIPKNTITFEKIISEIWKFICLDTVNNKTMFLNLINEGKLEIYLSKFKENSDATSIERKQYWEKCVKYYDLIKNESFCKNLNRYFLNVLLLKNAVQPVKRTLGIKPKTVWKIRKFGLMQMDVKVTHKGDLKNKVGYWIAIIDCETSLIYRRYYSTKPTGKMHIEFLNLAESYFEKNFDIKFATIQMDNAPEYSKFKGTLADVETEKNKERTHEEIELLKNLSTSVGQWTATRGITHLNIAKGRKESNGKVENSNKMIDYELLPLIHNVESNDVISKITEDYTELHNYAIKRRFLRTYEGRKQFISFTPYDWFIYVRELINTKKIMPNSHNCYYYFPEGFNSVTIE